ncbi:sensor histidine kinase [Hymenobacter latericus]|uniref:sensor histidine kinase n=1 Tax=Hymenobacter sp. YIM 151858-1 TaxID=2987688 RepID=UPI002226078B|nr:histidine kinase [Hymenobacter sp. YIM 151858-1]UYZ58845.1 histidine kinase [Hymenobacter sp. YIM 151858-1]
MEYSATSAALPASATTQGSSGRLRFISKLQWWPNAPGLASVPAWVHVLWVLLLVLTDVMHGYTALTNKNPPPLDMLVLRALLYDALASLIFYLNWATLIPRTLARNRLGSYVLGVLGLLLLFVPLRFGAGWLMKTLSEARDLGQYWVALLISYVVFGLMTIFFSSGLKVTGDYLLAQRNRRELERQQLLTELSLLKMQVNPHFLFNTLNNIYSLASQKSDRAPEAVLRLSEIMRYMLYESSADAVPLSKELNHLRSFLDLQRLRLPANGADAIVFSTAGISADVAYPIAPMLLQPLVENAFKHGDLTARPAVVIELGLDAQGVLHFAVQNATAPAAPGPALEQPGGVGLVNLRRRLELLYPERHHLHISEQPGQHRVELTLLPA